MTSKTTQSNPAESPTPIKYSYKKNTPWWLTGVMIVIAALAIIPISNLLVLLRKYFEFSVAPNLTLNELGQLGDFFGGHTSAFAGSISLVLVFFFTFHQAKQQAEFFRAQRNAEEINSARAYEQQRSLYELQQDQENIRARAALSQEKKFFVEQKMR